ncbi:MAG: hypothetical protein Q7U52_18120 [Hydrogenophaga sp.]|uniref:hypothetical protein n=1 Tax=Hydrogenophaga sp. TaxID=1904254 RepID=UPI00271CDD50|nr:hypothetical protein [Hydrogenophaga sp.]MDO9149541.1 hypothetical protein [Hydrogenophaga sp.]MDP2407172.1 hypothetical protein [Hydrogenophaga sp.]MDZ4175897.1 hypothetical protein [Hydrogenophaga sp.]
MPKAKIDEEIQAFAADVCESVAQVKRGEGMRVHTSVASDDHAVQLQHAGGLLGHNARNPQ